jgi:hypothetical protein
MDLISVSIKEMDIKSTPRLYRFSRSKTIGEVAAALRADLYFDPDVNLEIWDGRRKLVFDQLLSTILPSENVIRLRFSLDDPPHLCFLSPGDPLRRAHRIAATFTSVNWCTVWPPRFRLSKFVPTAKQWLAVRFGLADGGFTVPANALSRIRLFNEGRGCEVGNAFDTVDAACEPSQPERFLGVFIKRYCLTICYKNQKSTFKMAHRPPIGRTAQPLVVGDFLDRAIKHFRLNIDASECGFDQNRRFVPMDTKLFISHYPPGTEFTLVPNIHVYVCKDDKKFSIFVRPEEEVDETSEELSSLAGSGFKVVKIGPRLIELWRPYVIVMADLDQFIQKWFCRSEPAKVCEAIAEAFRGLSISALTIKPPITTLLPPRGSELIVRITPATDRPVAKTFQYRGSLRAHSRPRKFAASQGQNFQLPPGHAQNMGHRRPP